MGKHTSEQFTPLQIAVLTVSDTRDESSDTSGRYLVEQLQSAGHQLADKAIVVDDIYQIRAKVSVWLAGDQVQAILVTGGTGFTGRDSTPEALVPLFDKEVEGFGELFRQISYTEIGTSTIQSRAVAGMANGVFICCLPGSTGACRTGWENILSHQLDSRQGPCNFVQHLRNTSLEPCASRD